MVLKGTVFYIAENSKNQIRIKDKNIIIIFMIIIMMMMMMMMIIIIIILLLLLLLLLKNMKFPANQSLIRTSFKKKSTRK